MENPTTAFEQRRIDLGLTQAGLADRCSELGVKVGDSQLSKIERGVCVPRPPLRRALRTILGADPVKLARQQVEEPAEVA